MPGIVKVVLRDFSWHHVLFVLNCAALLLLRAD